MKKLALIACCLVICLMATSAMAANSVTIQSRTFTAGQTACTVGVFIENDIPLNGIVLPFEMRTQSGTAFYNGGLLAATWNFMPTGRLKNSPLSDAAEAGGLWPAGNVTRRQYADPVDPNSCSGPTSSSFGAQATRGDTISPDAFFLASVSTGDPNIGEEISMQPGTDGATPSMRLVLNLIADQNGCIIIDTACITPANHLLFVDENSLPVTPSFTPGLLTVGTGSCAVVVNQPPTAVCEPVTVYADGSCQGTVTPSELDPNVQSSDPEDGFGINYSMFPSPPFAVGQHQVNLVVTDSDGAADTCTTTLTVADTTKPVITCPSDIAVQCSSNIPAEYVNAAEFLNAGGTLSDNCAGWTMTILGTTSNGGSCPEILTRRYAITDAAGNADTCARLITVDDTTAPVITDCPNDTVINLPNGQTSTAVLYSDASITDNCNNVNIIHSPLSNSTFNVGTTQVRLIASDLCGNADTCFFNVTINELPPSNTPPNAVCQDLAISAGDDCLAFATANMFNNGSNDAEDGTNLILSVNPEGPYSTGVTQVWLVVMDQGGLKDSCSATITVEDATPPTVTCPDTVTVACFDDVPPHIADVAGFLAAGGTITDNCPGSFNLNWTGQGSTGDECSGEFFYGYIIRDSAGNEQGCAQVFLIRDTIDPVLGGCPSNIGATVSAGTTDTIINFTVPGASDNCDASATVVATPASGSSFPVGQTVVEIIATDNCGNADTCSFTVIVTEEVADAPPVAICTDVTVSVSDPSNCWADANINNGSFDPDGGSVTTDQNPAGPYPLGSSLVLLTVTDDEGDTDTCSAWVTVEDNTAPILSCPSDKEVSTDFGQCGADVNFDLITATDVCDEDLDFTYSHASGSFFPVGTTQVRVIATDDAGNADTCFFDVIVNDTEPPVAMCPSDTLTIPNDPGVCTAVYNFLFNGAGSTDNCSVESSVYDPAAGSTFPLGTTEVSHIVTDPSGNADTCYFFVTVVDTSVPTVTCPSDIKVFAPFGQSSAIVNYGAAAQDCGGLEIFTCTPPTGSAFPIGQTTVWCVAEDNAGNRDSCSFTVTVNPGSLEAPGPHTETDTLTFKVTCACDTQSIGVYCVEDPAKGDTGNGCLVYVQTQVPGISASPVPAQAPGTVDIIGCGIDQDPGSYSGWVFLHAATGAKTDSFWVILEVNEDKPGLDITPDTLVFTYTGDIYNDKLCLFANITSTGCDEQCWQFVGPSGEWVWVEPTSGVTPDEIEICVFPCTLGVGVYYQTLQFCTCPKGGDGPDPVGGCAQLVVKLNVVNPAPVLVVDPLEIHFEIDCEKKALPVPVYVNNGGGGVLDWFAFTEANWFVIEPDAGDAPDTFYVSIIPDSIPCPEVCDTLLDSICVTGNKGCAINSPQYVLVELIICPKDTVVCDSICGTVYDARCYKSDVCCIDSAHVELWSSYPDGVLLSETFTVCGDFCFDVEPGEEYDIRVWKKGWCTEVVGPWSCEDGHVTVVFDPLNFDPLPNWPYFTDYYSENAQFVVDDVLYLIQPGDVIYATDPQGVICGVAYVTTAGEYLIHVLGDDPKTVEDEGAVDLDSVTLWLNCECPAVAPDTWANFGSYLFDAIWDCDGPDELCCELCEGWNMWSYNIVVPDSSRENVLQTIDLNYFAVRSGLCDYGSISWFSNRPVNDLSYVPNTYGYDIYMLQTDTICLSGEFIDPTTPIYLCEGWNYIPYWPSSMGGLAPALASLDGNYSHIRTMQCGYGVQSWDESRPVENNDLWCMEPCKGYWINMKSEDTLIYPAEPEGCFTLAKTGASSSTGRATATPIVADYFASTSNLTSGSVISVYNSAGDLVGESYVGANGAFLLHVYGDVPQTSNVEGAVHGEALTFQVNGMAASASREIRWTENDNQQIDVSVDAAGAIPTEYALLQNYPNPFNAGTVIPFTMKDASEWTLTVYNIMGQTVQTFQGFDAPGTVRVDWNGLDRNGANVPSGVYFYRVTTDTWTATKKMTLLK